jgi:cytoskeleton protein RodZ
MTASNHDTNNTEPTLRPGPGAQLKNARQHQGLDLNGVSTHLHLPTSVVKALEEDDYEHLPSPVFVQGYLKNYARLLGVNEDTVVSAYQVLFPKDDELQVATNSSRKATSAKTLHSGSGIIRLITWGVSLILIALLYFWWQSRVELGDSLPVAEDTQEPAVVQSDSDTSVEDLTPFDEQATSFETPNEFVDMATVTAYTEEETLPDTLAVESEEMVSMEDLALNQIEDVPAEDVPAEDVPAEDVPAEDVQDEGVYQEEPSPETTANRAARMKGLVFSFSAPCWIEVRDRDGKVQIIGEMSANTVRRLDMDQGPFSVVLGNTTAVKVTIDGRPYDLQSHSQGRVARFTLNTSDL